MEFKVGDRVILDNMTPNYPKGSSNPLWGEYHVIGTVSSIRDSSYAIYVNWDNGTHNVYRSMNLKLAEGIADDIKSTKIDKLRWKLRNKGINI